MNRTTTALAALTTTALLCTVAPAQAGGHVTFPEYQRVQHGWSRDHVQRVFGTTGRSEVLYADGKHVHLTKSYPTDTRDTRVEIRYVGPLSQHPRTGPFHVVHKQLVGP